MIPKEVPHRPKSGVYRAAGVELRPLCHVTQTYARSAYQLTFFSL